VKNPRLSSLRLGAPAFGAGHLHKHGLHLKFHTRCFAIHEMLVIPVAVVHPRPDAEGSFAPESGQTSGELQADDHMKHPATTTIPAVTTAPHDNQQGGHHR